MSAGGHCNRSQVKPQPSGHGSPWDTPMKNLYFKVSLFCLPFLVSTAHFRLVPHKTVYKQRQQSTNSQPWRTLLWYLFKLLQLQELKFQCNYGQTETYCSNRFDTIVEKPISILILVTVICSLLCLQVGGQTLEQTYQPIWCLEWIIFVLHVIREGWKQENLLGFRWCFHVKSVDLLR